MSDAQPVTDVPGQKCISLVTAGLARLTVIPTAAAAALLALLALAVVLGGIVIAFLVWLAGFNAPPPPPTFTSSGPTVDRLQAMGEIVSTRVAVSAILEGKGEGYKGSWLVRGDALLTCDLNGATVVSSDEVTRTATIRIPGIHVLSPRVDHGRSKTWDVQKLSWMPWSGGDRAVLQDAAMYHAQKLVERTASEDEYLQMARDQAELVLRKSYAMVGWNVSVVWEE